MKTKLQNILETFDEKDIAVFKSLITTRLMDGSDKHFEYLHTVLIKENQQGSNKSNLPIKERLIMSDLFKMAETYVIIRESLKNNILGNHTLLAYYRRNENEKLFNESYNHFIAKSNMEVKNADYHHYYSDLQYEKWQFDQVKNRFSNAEAKEIIHHYDIALISKKLMQAVTLGEQSSLISKNIDLGFIDPLEAYILQNNLLIHPCISLYYFALKLIYLELNLVVWQHSWLFILKS